MQLPFFYLPFYQPSTTDITLDEDTSRHVVQVLRMKQGQQLHLTDGLGNLLLASITEEHKKHCRVRIESVEHSLSTTQTTIAISLVKNNNRFEWFLEKATEIGVKAIVPLICERTEKEKFRSDRLKQIVISAMLQSRQTWLPVLHEPVDYALLSRMEEIAAIPHKFIAHCIEDEPRSNLTDLAVGLTGERIILIGPEGDFSPAEIKTVLDAGYRPVSLGETRLRTETAGMVAAVDLR